MGMLGGVAGRGEAIGVWCVVGEGEGECSRPRTKHADSDGSHWRAELYRDDKHEQRGGLVMAGDATG